MTEPETRNISVSAHVHACLYLLKGRLGLRSYSEVIQDLIAKSPYKEFSRPNVWDAFAKNQEESEQSR